jgi:hypothetical protein
MGKWAGGGKGGEHTVVKRRDCADCAAQCLADGDVVARGVRRRDGADERNAAELDTCDLYTHAMREEVSRCTLTLTWECVR